MLKIILLLSLMMNLSFAKDRFTEDEKKLFLNDLKTGITEHKTENNGKVDLQIIKPGLYKELEQALKLGKFTNDELSIIKNHYEIFSKDPKITPANAEASFYAFMQNELNNVNKAPLIKKGPMAICQTPTDCAEGLKCILDPQQFNPNSDLRGKRAGQSCNSNAECASQLCSLDENGKNVKVCEEAYRCYAPLRLNDKCGVNPYCGEGDCTNFNTLTSDINECTKASLSCDSDSKCCSGSCVGGKCEKDNYLCLKCTPQNSVPKRGDKCCKGYYPNQFNICTPDFEPGVIWETYTAPVKTFLISLSNLFISSADAGEIANVQKQFDLFLEQNANTPIGSSFNFGLGKFTVLPTGNIKFTSNTGASVELTEKSNIIKVATASPDLRKSFAQAYGLDPIGSDKNQQAANATSIYNLAEIEKARPRTSAEKSTSVSIPGYGAVKYTYAHTTGSGEDMVQVPASITSAFGEVFSPASAYYASNEFAAMTGKKMTEEDYKFLEDEKKAATRTAQSGATDGSAAAALEDETTFLNLGAVNDGLDLASGVHANKDKLDKLHVSKESEALNMEKDKPKLNFKRSSNFTTCDIQFKDDFYNALKTDGAFDLEVAMLGFEFVVTGDSESDYWRGGSVASFPSVGVAGVSEVHDKFTANLVDEANKNASLNNNSIYNRLKAIGLAHRLVRQNTNKRIADITKKLTCACLDVQGYNKIVNNEKKKFFESSCEEYAKYKNPETSLDELNGDASGLKGKRMLIIWTQNLQQFHASLAVDNNAAYTELLKVSNFVSNEARFNETERRNYDLFKFTIKNPSGAVAGLGAIVGALLAAGVIAIMGGFATTSILSVWGAAGIIAASAVTGAGGMWMVATLKGAWITMKPEISDGIVMPRTYSCGKKESCTDYTRTLVQPYNTVCNKHTSANACIKSFIVVNEGREARYIVDPWIPVGVTRTTVTRNQPNYVEKLEEGFVAAKNAMVAKNPGATGATGKKGEGNFVSESYLSEIFIDANVVGQYTPAIGNNMQENYYFGQDRVKIIKEAAKKFAVAEGFLEANDEENLNEFADYAYEYHFLWPKKTRPGEVSYPTVGLTAYMSFMSKEVSGNLSAGLSRTAIRLSRLQEQYQRDYNKTFDLYNKTLNQVDGLKKSIITTETNKNNAALANIMNFNSLLDSKSLDQQLAGLGANTNGTTLSGASLTNGQTSFLNAVSNLRNTRKAQLKTLEHYKKAMAASGDKERAARVSAATKKFSKNFATGNASFSGARIGSNSSPMDSSSSASAIKDENANAGAYGADGSGFNNNGISGTGGLFGAGSGSGAQGSKSTSSDGSGRSGVSDADTSKLADAIDARNKDGKGKYQSTDGQSLFEKVTNAYIRNYDKVLTKKKDKDVVEEKQ